MTPVDGSSRFVRLEDPRDPLEGVSLLLISHGVEEVQEKWGPLWVETIRIRLEDRQGERCDLRTSAETCKTERCMIIWLEGDSCWDQLETMV